MAGYFCDSSAVVKRYISEVGTNWVIGLMRPPTKISIQPRKPKV